MAHLIHSNIRHRQLGLMTAPVVLFGKKSCGTEGTLTRSPEGFPRGFSMQSLNLNFMSGAFQFP